MTHPGNDPSPIWLKQVPNFAPNAPATWSRRLIPEHHTVDRSSRRPDLPKNSEETIED